MTLELAIAEALAAAFWLAIAAAAVLLAAELDAMERGAIEVAS